MAEPNEVGGAADARLALIAVRRHAGRALEGAEEPQRRQTRGVRDVREPDLPIEMTIDKVPSQPERSLFSTRWRRRESAPRVVLEEARNESEVCFLAPQRRPRGFRAGMKLAEERGQRPVADDRAGERGGLVALALQRVETAGIDIKRPQAPTAIVDGPAGMRLIGVDRVEVTGARHEFGAAHPDADGAARDQGEASLVVGMDVVGIIAEASAQQFRIAEILGAPDLGVDSTKTPRHCSPISPLPDAAQAPLVHVKASAV